VSPRDCWNLAEGDEIAPSRHAVQLLGGGRRYEAYLAWDDELWTLVVAKLVRPSLVGDPSTLRGLAGEIQALERLAHPAIVRSFGSTLGGERPHVVLEHLDGPRLSTLIRRFGVIVEQLLPLALELCSALHYMSTRGIVHLDVKPRNVIMSAPPRLIDLSVATPVDEVARLATPTGTDAYMAPEQCDPRERGPITAAADVWGMGATLYHAAAGHAPFRRGVREGDRDERFPQLRDAPAPLPKSVAPEVAALILSCLDPDPAGRPTPAELAAEFEYLVDALPKRPKLRRFRVGPRY
jgi:eukaryotic-like serine/threonine-protein kinase